MPRAARVVAEGVPHHITQRGNNRQDIFLLETKTGGSTSRHFAPSRDIQWDYRNLIRRKGRLERLK